MDSHAVQALHVGWSCSGKNSEAREVFSGGSEEGHRLKVGLSSPTGQRKGHINPGSRAGAPPAHLRTRVSKHVEEGNRIKSKRFFKS